MTKTPNPVAKHDFNKAKNANEAALKAAGSDCCGNPSQCWEPCGDLGKSEEHARVVDIELPGSN